MNNLSAIIRTLIACLIFSFICNSLLGQEKVKNNEEQSGLIGVFFDHSDFTRPVSIWKALSLNSSKLDWPEHNDFSAQWLGSIEALTSGPVTFSGETDAGLWLEIDGKVVIDSWANPSANYGSVMMEAGERYTIRLHYRQLSRPSYFRLSWSKEGSDKTPIPGDVLHYTSQDKKEMREIFRQEIDLVNKELEFDISKLLNIENRADIDKKRSAFNIFLFGNEGIPLKKGIDLIEGDIQDNDFKELDNLKEIKKLTINMDYDLHSIVYHFIPAKVNDRAVIYHQGHNGKFSLGITTIAGLLSEGYNVIGISMPLKGFNNQPVVDLDRFGKMNINSHGRMGFLKPKQGHPVKYFLEPVFRVINYLQNLGFKKVNMTGISGGGWTTTLCAAMDTRIQYSYPVAGSLPIYLRIRDPKDSSWGDYEQVVPELYRIANYLELYVMGATGRNRRQIQILNEFDSCCFSGTGYKTYEDIVTDKVISLGKGSFEVFLDSSHEDHKISEIALDFILKDLEK